MTDTDLDDLAQRIVRQLTDCTNPDDFWAFTRWVRSRLGEAVAGYKTYADETQQQNIHLRDKVMAAEARVRELEEVQ